MNGSRHDNLSSVWTHLELVTLVSSCAQASLPILVSPRARCRNLVPTCHDEAVFLACLSKPSGNYVSTPLNPPPLVFRSGCLLVWQTYSTILAPPVNNVDS
ncbi:hypothetical protein Hypma_013996 [Hypsizygus marmoreus]|uniref:Uncharacterized protein n=1 Tax=Hypsizygus marmoreus TaxID=39966 RepID=A0A369K5K1_HYPMA|nr:hypothetical protein Hypma_013996 [Hypsizygus marmoreus]